MYLFEHEPTLYQNICVNVNRMETELKNEAKERAYFT